MKSLTLCVLLSVLGISHSTYPLWLESHVVHNLGHFEPVYETFEARCDDLISNEITLEFQRNVYDVIAILFHKIVVLSDAHFAFSPLTIWKALAAIAEGSEGETRQELFKFLRLPEDKCIRQIYYQLSSSQEDAFNDLDLGSKKLLIADSSVILNRNWKHFVMDQRLINVEQVSYKGNPSETENWKRTFNAQLPNINLNGNSLILESLDYHGLWTSAFSDVEIEPFYNTFGEQIASIEYMKMRKRVSVAYLPTLNMKVLELPVGKDSRYRMLFGLVMDQEAFKRTLGDIQGSALFETYSNIKRSRVPIQVAIPRMAMTSEVDVRKVLEQLGISRVWTDPYATRNISVPSALPSSFIQRVTVTLENSGVRPNVLEYSNLIPPVHIDTTDSGNATGLDPAVGQDFIANRPFLFGLFDSETFMCLFLTSFSKPTY